VIGSTSDGRAIFAPEWIDWAEVLGVVPKACRPYRAKTKGKAMCAHSRPPLFAGRMPLSRAAVAEGNGPPPEDAVSSRSDGKLVAKPAQRARESHLAGGFVASEDACDLPMGASFDDSSSRRPVVAGRGVVRLHHRAFVRAHRT